MDDNRSDVTCMADYHPADDLSINKTIVRLLNKMVVFDPDVD